MLDLLSEKEDEKRSSCKFPELLKNATKIIP
jgi:hypothetical protein